VRRFLLAVLIVLAGASPAQAAVDRTVTSGSLRATVTPAPLAVTFSGSADLRETRLGPTLGGALSVIDERRDGDAYVATLTGGGQLRIAPRGDGAITQTVTGVGGPVTATFAATPDERYLGFGERSNAVDQRGGEVLNHVSEGPYQAIEQPFIAAFVPLAGYNPRADASYYPLPWLLSTRGYGVLDDDASDSVLHLAGRDAWTVTTNGSAQTLRVYGGPSPAQVLRRFTADSGRQPPAAAPWFFGPWWQPNGGDDANVKTLRDAGALGSVVQTYTHYLPCADHLGRREAQQTRVAKLHALGLAVTTYFNPMICTSHPRFGAAEAAGVLTKNVAGRSYTYRYTGSSQFFVGQFDFSNPAATPFFGELLREATDDGYDGWMEDFGEYTPLDSVSADGRPAEQAHNLYPTLYHRAARAFSATHPRPLARFNRSGWIGTAPSAQIVWGGDPTTGWGFDGLASSVRNALTMGLSGVSLWGSDVGGFFALATPQTTPELLVRWIQFGFASAIMRTQANGFALLPSPRAQIFDKDVLPVWARYAKLRTQLLPYLAAADREYQRTGMPIMRQLALAFPGDPRATARDDEFLLGPDLLAAPVLLPGATRRSLYLPAGRWVDLWRSLTLDAAGAPVLGAAELLAGGRDVTLPAPLIELPLLARAGTLLALLPADVQTLTGYGAGVVRMRDRAARATLVGWPAGGVARAEIARGETASVRLRGRRLHIRISGRRQRRIAVQLSLAALPRPLRPCRVRARGGRVLSWRYDRASGVLRTTLRMRDGVAVVEDCRG
jgi:alpha-glucosidase